MKYQRTLFFLAISLSFSGCAVTSGLQTYDLPDQGSYKTDQGAELSVVQLTQNSLPEIVLSTTQSTTNIIGLFKNNKTYIN